MKMTERPAKRTLWPAVAIAALAAAMMLAPADGAVAKKRPFKTGEYVGDTGDTVGGRGIRLEVHKKKVGVSYFGWNSCTPVPPLGGGLPQYAGISGKIEVKKVDGESSGFDWSGRKRVGVFKANHPYGYVAGYLKGTKAHGDALDQYACPDTAIWGAHLEK